MGYKRELEIASASLREMHKRGIRILPGGDYGFAWMPHGTNANDLQYFVDYIGMTPKEALMAATRLGGKSWEQLGVIWLKGFDRLRARATFLDAAHATVDVAAARHGKGSVPHEAVKAGWKAVNVLA